MNGVDAVEEYKIRSWLSLSAFKGNLAGVPFPEDAACGSKTIFLHARGRSEWIVGHPSRVLASSRCRLDSDRIVYGDGNSLPTADVAPSRLDDILPRRN
jgi:hypothetical protein